MRHAVAVLLALLIPLTATGATMQPAGRLNLKPHAAGIGFRLPTFAGPCLEVAGTSEGDLCWDSTNDALYVWSGAAYGAIGSGSSYTLTAQSLPTFNPAGSNNNQAREREREYECHQCFV